MLLQRDGFNKNLGSKRNKLIKYLYNMEYLASH